MPTLTARACVRYGWHTFAKRPWFFIGAVALFLVTVLVLDSISGIVFTRTLGVPLVAVVVNWAVQILASMGLIAFMLRAYADPARAELRNLWHPQPFWRYLGAYLLFALIVLCGFVLIIIPGIIWAVMFSFALYLVIDRGRAPVAALKESARLTRGHRWMLFRLSLLVALVELLGFICFGVGILVAIPVALLASIHAYRTLSSVSTFGAPISA